MLSSGLAILWRFPIEEDKLVFGDFRAESAGDLWAKFLLPWSCAGVYCLFPTQGLSSIVVLDIGPDFGWKIEEGISLGFGEVFLREN